MVQCRPIEACSSFGVPLQAVLDKICRSKSPFLAKFGPEGSDSYWGDIIGVIELHPILEAVKSELPTPLDHIYARTFGYQMVLRSSCHGYVHNSYKVIFMRSWSVHTLGGHGWDGKPSPPHYDTWD